MRDVTIRASNRGIGFQQRTGPGAYSNVTIERVDIEARGVTGNTWWGAGEAIWVTVVPERTGLPYALGGIHGVVFRNVTTMSEQVEMRGHKVGLHVPGRQCYAPLGPSACRVLW